MTTAEIVYTAIKKAQAGGFYPGSEVQVITHPLWVDSVKEIRLLSESYTPNPFVFHPLEILFSIPFAKAFWGREKVKQYKNILSDNPLAVDDEAWHFHLQQLVVCVDPIKYLAKFI